jgi:hypothetical protein
MNIVADHLKELMLLIPLSQTEYRPIPKESLTPKENQLFWRYHGHFPNDFARAVSDCLPESVKFVQYDHLTNRVTVEEV